MIVYRLTFPEIAASQLLQLQMSQQYFKVRRLKCMLQPVFLCYESRQHLSSNKRDEIKKQNTSTSDSVSFIDILTLELPKRNRSNIDDFFICNH